MTLSSGTGASLAQRGNLKLETFPEPVLFVAEVWSKSTGEYDVDTKIPDYLARGDAVVWRLHPYDSTVTAWTRKAEGGYDEARHSSGRVPMPRFPGVSIDLESPSSERARLLPLPILPNI